MATMLPGFGAAHMAQMRGYPRMAIFVAMLHDRSAGTVSVAAGRPRLHYSLDRDDQRALLSGMRACAELLFAAGAERVLVPFSRPLELSHVGELERIPAHGYRPLDPLLTAVHPMGTLALGQVVDERGQWRGMRRLWVADSSLFPTSLAAPPQLTIYAAAHQIAAHLIAELR
jgi:choline dehydrogenase-like flavoprotein